MNRLLFSAILSVFTICLCACSGDVVKKPEKFLKQEDALPWLPINSTICDIDGKESVLFSMNGGYAICAFDIETKKIDTIVARVPAGIGAFCYNADNGTILVQLDNRNLNLWNPKSCTEMLCPSVKYHEEFIIWTCGAYHPFFSCGDILYTGIIPSLDSEVDYADFRAKSDLMAAWDISNPDSVRFVKIFGKRPSDQPKDMFIKDCYQTAFNVEDSIIVAGTELSQNVVVMSMNGEKLKEKELTSKFYVKPQKRDFSQSSSVAEIIEYCEENMLFGGLYYDRYRKLYYRVLNLATQKDGNSFTKKKSDWVLIVADSSLNKKYEIQFDGDKHRGVILIGKQGIYIRTADNPKNKTMDLFVFD